MRATRSQQRSHIRSSRRLIRWTSLMQKDAEILVERDAGVEDDRAPPHLPRAVLLTHHVLAAAGEQLIIGLRVRVVHQKRGPGLDLAALQRRRFELIR